MSVVGNIGLFLTDVLLNAYALVGMAERGLVRCGIVLPLLEHTRTCVLGTGGA